MLLLMGTLAHNIGFDNVGSTASIDQEMTKDFGDFAQKAFYLGLEFASAAVSKASSVAGTFAERASEHLSDLRQQAEKLTNDLVERGLMSAEEARTFMDTVVNKSTPPTSTSQQATAEPSAHNGPRKIQIDDHDETAESDVTLEGVVVDEAQPRANLVLDRATDDQLRRQIEELEAELQRLKETY